MDEIMMAYIDPGTGSLLLSFILGSTIGAGVFLRRTMYRVVGWVTGKGQHTS